MADGVRKFFEDSYAREVARQRQYQKEMAKKQQNEEISSRQAAAKRLEAREKSITIAGIMAASGAFEAGDPIVTFARLYKLHPFAHPIESFRNRAYNRSILKPFGEHVIVDGVKIRKRNAVDIYGNRPFGPPETVAIGGYEQGQCAKGLKLTDLGNSKDALYLLQDGIRLGTSLARGYDAQEMLETADPTSGYISEGLNFWQFNADNCYSEHTVSKPLPTVVEVSDVTVESYSNPIRLHGWLSALATSSEVKIPQECKF